MPDTHIPETQDDGSESLRQRLTISPALPQLNCLCLGANEQVLEILSWHAPNLKSLALQSRCCPPTTHILRAASGFTRLTRLSITFSPDCSVQGHDLLLLVQRCPSLEQLFFGMRVILLAREFATV